MRAREPDEQGYVDRDGMRIGYETFNGADADSRPSVSSRRSTVRAQPRVEGTGRRTSPSTTAWSRSTRGATAAPAGRPTPRRTTTCDSSPTPWRSWITSASSGPYWWHLRQRLAVAAPRVAASRAGPGRGRGGAVGHGTPRRRWPSGWRPPRPSRKSSTSYEGGSRNRHYSRTTGPTSPTSSSASMLCEPHSTKQLEDILGSTRTAEVQLAEPDAAAPRGHAEESEALLRGIDHPCWCSRDRRPLSAARPGENVVRCCGASTSSSKVRGTCRWRGTRSGQPGDQELRRPGRRRTAPQRRRSVGARRGRERSTSARHRPRSRAPRPGHRRCDARTPPRPGDPVAHPVAGRGVPREARRGGAPRVAVAGQRVRALRGGVRRARPPRLPGRAAHGRGAGEQLHGLRRPGRTGVLRPLAGGRGVGPRPLPARAPRAKRAPFVG